MGGRRRTAGGNGIPALLLLFVLFGAALARSPIPAPRMILAGSIPVPDLALTGSGIGERAGGRRVYEIRLHAIRTADDDGSHAATILPEEVTRLVDAANRVYEDAGIRFRFDPDTDFETRRDTLLNQDRIVRGDPAAFRSREAPPPSDEAVVAAARERVALGMPGRLVVFFRYGTTLAYDERRGRWSVGPATGGFSSAEDEFVAMWRGMPEPNLLAHEIGHYLHNRHTFGLRPRTVAEAATLIRDYVENRGHPVQDGLNVFDHDAVVAGVTDTPPDAGDDLFASATGDRCGPAVESIEIPVTFADGTSATYRLKPERGNIMSYFKDCAGFRHHLSPQQAARARASLETGNRRHLIEPGR